jgi:hypothetical protein
MAGSGNGFLRFRAVRRLNNSLAAWLAGRLIAGDFEWVQHAEERRANRGFDVGTRFLSRNPLRTTETPRKSASWQVARAYLDEGPSLESALHSTSELRAQAVMTFCLTR